MNFNLLARDIRARLERTRYIGREKLDTLYLATVQKAGSQWMSAIFNDPRVKAATGLVRMPQRYYEYGQHVKKFPKGVFVPGLYVSYQTFENFIDKPRNYRVIYVYRDPRDLVVSDYYSTLKTHESNPGVDRLRTRLESMSKEDGISYLIKYYDKFSVIRSWVELGAADANVSFVKFEDLTTEPFRCFKELLDDCGVSISDEKLEDILSDYAKDKMRSRDLAKRSDKSESHYRFKPSSHREEFGESHHKLFREVTGNLIEILGYS